MKYALISLALLFTGVCLSQSDTAKYALNIHFNNGIAYRTISSDHDVLLNWNENEKMRFVQGGGIQLSRHLGTHISVSTGLVYQQLGHQMDSISGIKGAMQSFNFVQVPISLTYHFTSERRLTPFVSAGFQYGFMVSSRLSYQSETDNRLNSTNNVAEWNRSVYSGVGALGCSIAVYPRNEFNVGLLGQWALNSLTTSDLKRNPYSCSLQLGWRYIL